MSRPRLDVTQDRIVLTADGRELAIVDDVFFAHDGLTFRWRDAMQWTTHPAPIREGHRAFRFAYDVTEPERGEDLAGEWTEWTVPFGTGNPTPDCNLVVRAWDGAVAFWIEPLLDRRCYHAEAVGGLRLAAPDGPCAGSWIEREYSYHTYAPTGTWGHLRPMTDVFRGVRAASTVTENPFGNQLGCFAWWRRADGPVAALLPSAAEGCYSYLRVPDGDGIEVVATGMDGTTNYAGRRIPLATLALADETGAATDRAFGAARAILPTLRLRDEKPRPPLLDHLGYSDFVATAYWSQRTEDVSERTITGVLDAGVPLGFVVDISASGLFGMGEAARDTERYADMARIVRRLRDEYGVAHVGTWVQTFEGAHAGNPLVAEHPDWFITTNAGARVPDPDNPDSAAFYDVGCRVLADLGFDHFKLDFPMFCFNHFGNRRPVEDAMATFCARWQAATDAHGLTIIGCCGSLVETWAQFGSVNVGRVSADYHASEASSMADETSGGARSTPEGVARSVRHHVVDSFYCSHYLSRVEWPDFDMFNTSDVGAKSYAVASALSGGLVYLSDEPHRVDLDVVRRLAFADGRVPQPDAPGRPLERQFFASPHASGTAFVAHAPAGDALVVGVFNLADDGEPVRCEVVLDELPLAEADEYLVWRHFEGRGEIVPAGAVITCDLAPLEAEALVVAPVRDGVAVAGLVDKIVAPAGVESVVVEEGVLKATLVEPGRFVAAVSGRIEIVESEAGTVTI